MKRITWIAFCVLTTAVVSLAFAVRAESEKLHPRAPAGVHYVNQGSEGRPVDITKHVVRGKINVFDFYSKYCGPCMRIAPLLEKLAEKRHDVVVHKVDINRPGVEGIDWRSPLAQQYKLESIPHFKVFDAKGKKIADGEAGTDYVIKMLQASHIQ